MVSLSYFSSWNWQGHACLVVFLNIMNLSAYTQTALLYSHGQISISARFICTSDLLMNIWAIREQLFIIWIKTTCNCAAKLWKKCVLVSDFGPYCLGPYGPNITDHHACRWLCLNLGSVLWTWKLLLRYFEAILQYWIVVEAILQQISFSLIFVWSTCLW